jgi:hypothetical protein
MEQVYENEVTIARSKMRCESCGENLAASALFCMTCLLEKANKEERRLFLSRLWAGELKTIQTAGAHVMLRKGLALCQTPHISKFDTLKPMQIAEFTLALKNEHSWLCHSCRRDLT